MKKTLKALWQAIKTVVTGLVDSMAKLFGIKKNTTKYRVLHKTVGTVFAAVAVVGVVQLLLLLGQSIFGQSDRYDSVSFSDKLSNNISYYDDYESINGYLQNEKGKKVLKHISWIIKPSYGDSLYCYNDGTKCGYFHARDGRVVVKPIYEHAWAFSEGLAAVEEKGQVKFIDTTGNVVIDGGFAYDDMDDGYEFHNGFCAVNDSTGMHMGLIDRYGNWVLSPAYCDIMAYDTFWIVTLDNMQSVITIGMDTVIPMTSASFIIDDVIIYATFKDHTMSTFSLQGKLLEKQQIGEVTSLMYKTRDVIFREPKCGEDYSDENNFTQLSAVATCLCYESDSEWYGLMSPDGKILTPPIYISITAVDKDLYLCKTDFGRGIMLNSKGQRVGL